MIFWWLHFPHLCSIGGQYSKKINFLKKKIEKLEIVKWSEMDFALEKSTKNRFFSDLMTLKKKLKNFGNRKVVWNGIERLALNALNLCMINAKIQRYICKIYAKIQRKIM